jgi:hypothetical protein
MAENSIERRPILYSGHLQEWEVLGDQKNWSDRNDDQAPCSRLVCGQRGLAILLTRSVLREKRFSLFCWISSSSIFSCQPLNSHLTQTITCNDRRTRHYLLNQIANVLAKYIVYSVTGRYTEKIWTYLRIPRHFSNVIPCHCIRKMQ